MFLVAEGAAGIAGLVGTGIGLSAAGAGIGWLVNHDPMHDAAKVGAFIGAATSLAAAPVAGARCIQAVGEKRGHHGSIGTAVLGFWLSVPVAGGVGAIGASLAASGPDVPSCILWGIAALIPPTGMVIGYNLSRRKPAAMPYGGYGSRLGPPSIALRAEEIEHGEYTTALDVRAVTLKF